MLSLAAYVIALPRDNVSDVTQSYFAQARPFYILMALYFVLLIVADLATLSEYLSENTREGGLSRAQLVTSRLAEATIFLVLAHTRKQAFQLFVLSSFWQLFSQPVSSTFRGSDQDAA
jgi:hypothetical protein